MKHTKEILVNATKEVTSFSQLALRLGLKPIGSTITHLGRRCRLLEVDTSHFTSQGHNKGKHARNRLTPDEVFSLTSWSGGRISGKLLKRALLEIGVEETCTECNLGTTWNGKPLALQVDHIDGDFSNNNKENLRFICPNCHVQTETWGSKNIAQVGESVDPPL